MVQLHIGFDDTDSPKGGCTTYIAALLVEKFRAYGVNFLDYPNLIFLGEFPEKLLSFQKKQNKA
ncbi:MAG: hypothetical protein P8X97_04430 [Candidatus Bathyarchaeota archaeon]